MAATLHVDDAFPVNRPRSPSGDDTSLSVIGLGPFGERVAQHLLGTRPDAKRVAAADLGNAFTATGEAVVLALWRPEPELCEQADELSWRRGVPWLPVVMDHRAVSVGPLVSQPGPCFRCYRRRREQHDVQPAATAALLAAYARDAGAGPAGYLPHHARMAAGLATQMLRGDLVPAAAWPPGRPGIRSGGDGPAAAGAHHGQPGRGLPRLRALRRSAGACRRPRPRASAFPPGPPSPPGWTAPGGGRGPMNGRKPTLLTVRPGLIAAPAGDALVLEGGPRRHLLKGGAVTSVLPVLPTLWPLLDGGHDRETICSQTGLSREMLEEFGRLLADCGALEPVAGGPGGGTAPAGGPVLTFLSRTARAADGEPSGAARAVAMAGSAVLVISPAAAGEPITADLAETGVGLTATAEDCDLLTAEQWLAASSARRGAVAVFDDPHADGAPEKLAEAVAQCHRHGLPLLRFSWGAGHVEIGPLFQPGEPVCARCFRCGLQAMTWPAEATGGDPGARELAAADLVTGLVTAHLLALMSDLAAPAPPRTLSRMTWPGYQLTSYDVVPEPDCAPCAGRLAGHDGPVAPTTPAFQAAAAYEWLESGEPAGPGTAVSPAEAQRITDMAARRSRMTTGPRIPLEVSSPELSRLGIPAILSQLRGWRPATAADVTERTDPSQDDLSAVQIYVVTDGPRGDLPGAIFRYDHMSGELVGTQAGPCP